MYGLVVVVGDVNVLFGCFVGDEFVDDCVIGWLMLVDVVFDCCGWCWCGGWCWGGVWVWCGYDGGWCMVVVVIGV